MQQPSLWGDEQEVPPGYIKVPAMGETVEKEERWADGDISLEQLERLAHIMIGKSEAHWATNGEQIWFRCVATRIEGDHVIATHRRIEPILRSYLNRLRENGKQADEGEEEY